MPYTGTFPYTAQDFVAGNKARAQDVTDMSYAVARLDKASASSWCFVQKSDNLANQTTGTSASTTLTFPTAVADPSGLIKPGTTNTFTINQPGLWSLSAYYANTDKTANEQSIGGWFHITNSGYTADWGATRSNTFGENEGLWCTMNITMPFSLGDQIQVVAHNYDTTNSMTTYRAVFSLSLFHSGG